jgi:VIT1/CCC1 family predicted Fe2+/Mn2+ transporter
MRAFIHRYLDPAGRLGEILFGLVMALGFTGSVRLGLDDPDNRELFVGILGCNLAWAIVDGVMYVLTELFERGRRARLVREVHAARSDEEAIEQIARELDDRLGLEETTADRETFHRWMLEFLRRAQPVAPSIRREDVLGGVAVALVILLATLPVVVPFLLVRDPDLAVRVSNGVALTLLFLLGASWGRTVGGRPWRIGAGLTGVGIVLVLITIALGG